MLSPQALLRGFASRILPYPNLDSQQQDVGVRLGRYGDVLDPLFTKHKLADEGIYFTACMTPGQAALAYGVQASFSDTAGFVVIQNIDQPLGQGGTGKRIFLDYLKFIISTAPASSTAAWMALKLDSGNRAPTANSTNPTVTNVNIDSPTGSISKIWFPSGGTLTVPATVNPRLVFGNLNLRTTIPVVSDEYYISFGPTDWSQTPGANLPAALATVACQRYAAPAFAIGPQDFAIFYLWFPSNATTAAQFSNIELGLIER